MWIFFLGGRGGVRGFLPVSLLCTAASLKGEAEGTVFLMQKPSSGDQHSSSSGTGPGSPWGTHCMSTPLCPHIYVLISMSSRLCIHVYVLMSREGKGLSGAVCCLDCSKTCFLSHWHGVEKMNRRANRPQAPNFT